ncbi:MAG: hypothetical protein JOY83_15060, partial [Alphaproteobacteria bacterium]|nr:hypothetical protein [Alphaproteobacteria bacterium]
AAPARPGPICDGTQLKPAVLTAPTCAYSTFSNFCKIATSHSIATALPLLALSFFLIAPMFLFVARETTRKELADFVGQRTL